MTLPLRFAVWEFDEFHTGVLQICNTQRLRYDADTFLRIYPEDEPPHLSEHRSQFLARLRDTILYSRHGVLGRKRVQITHSRASTMYFCITNWTVACTSLYNGHEIDEELPVVLVYGEYLFGTSRSPLNYTLSITDTHRYRQTVEQLYQSLVNHFELPYMRRLAPTLWEDDLPRLDGAGLRRGRTSLRHMEEVPRAASQAVPPASVRTPRRPSERIALAIARDFQRQGETCPITQDALKLGEICVTGCLCVFQAEPLQAWARDNTSCPSCRKPLVYRTIRLPEPETSVIPN